MFLFEQTFAKKSHAGCTIWRLDTDIRYWQMIPIRLNMGCVSLAILFQVHFYNVPFGQTTF